VRGLLVIFLVPRDRLRTPRRKREVRRPTLLELLPRRQYVGRARAAGLHEGAVGCGKPSERIKSDGEPNRVAPSGLSPSTSSEGFGRGRCRTRSERRSSGEVGTVSVDKDEDHGTRWSS
jgi:hypothetical protein